MDEEMTWPLLCHYFQDKYRSNTKRTQLNETLKELNYEQFLSDEKSGEVAVENLLAEVERFFCLPIMKKLTRVYVIYYGTW